jgi:hypothetical protein
VAYCRLVRACQHVDRLGDSDPLVIGFDSHGESTYHDPRETARKRLENIYVRL